MSWGRGRAGKMGFEGSGPAPRRQEPSAMRVGGVEFQHSKLNGWRCSLCNARLGPIEAMVPHARTHAGELERAATLERIGAVLARLDADQLAAVAETVPAIAACPAGFAVVARALASGQHKHPGRGLGPSPDQRVYDHVEALWRHVHKAFDTVSGALAIDSDTGLPHAGLAAARGVLAIQRAGQGDEC